VQTPNVNGGRQPYSRRWLDGAPFFAACGEAFRVGRRLQASLIESAVDERQLPAQTRRKTKWRERQILVNTRGHRTARSSAWFQPSSP